LIGVEIAAAVKNIIAIAAGVVDGLGLGSNATAALVTRGLAEITRLVAACGGKRETVSGLAGLGDLVLTSYGNLSRNRRVGIALGQGKSIQDVLGNMRMVAEGVKTTKSTVALARKLNIEMPIAEKMYSVLYEDRKPQDAIRELMERKLKEE
jgi:glycerol-3-phosphate dehydrogenase (NAD(P)+)